MEISHIISISVASIAGIATIVRAWNSIISKQDSTDLQIAHIINSLENIPGNDPELFRSVADCISNQHNCDASSNMKRIEESLNNMKNDISEIKEETQAWQQQIRVEMISMGALIAKVKTQLNERTSPRWQRDNQTEK
jgi:hypothetical protein